MAHNDFAEFIVIQSPNQLEITTFAVVRLIFRLMLESFAKIGV